MKTKKLLIYYALFFLFSVVSCDTLDINDANLNALSTAEVVQGLKKALEIGTDTATSTLSLTNGYYGNALLKIPLPDEAELVRQQIVNLTNKVPALQSVFDLDAQFENVVLSINRAAEEAAAEAKPIFVDAITGLSFSQGMDILHGINPADSLKSDGFDSTAATGYFKVVTFNALQNLYAPKIDAQLHKDFCLGFSANQAWSILRNAVNNSLNQIEGNIITNALYVNSGYTVNRIEQESLGLFATERALNGLFTKVGDEEKKIRKNPYEWAVDIIQKVFGSVMKNI